MHRNVTIVVIILIFVVIIAYLIWLRNKIDQPSLNQEVNVQTENVITTTPSPMATQSASPSATPAVKQATASAKQKTATPSANKK